jgi:hypothetical protein
MQKDPLSRRGSRQPLWRSGKVKIRIGNPELRTFGEAITNGLGGNNMRSGKVRVVITVVLAVGFFILFCVVMVNEQAYAKCVCRCVNGEMKPLCTSSLEIPPICPPTICPLTPPKIEPLPSLELPPLGTESCRWKQVLNPYTNRYEWKRVCQ